MAKRTFKALAIVLAVSVVALGSFAAGTTARTVADTAGGDSADSGKSFMGRLASRMHGGGHHGHHGGGRVGHGEFWKLVAELELSPEQRERLEAIHRSMGSLGHGAEGSMAGLHDQLVEHFERGDIEADAVRQMVDQHLDQIRTAAYSAADELVAVVNSLDARQREIVLEHFREAERNSDGHAH